MYTSKSKLALGLGSLALSHCVSSASPWPTQSFYSMDLHPPVLEITKSAPTAPGYLFFSPTGISALIMADDRSGGDLIWEGPSELVFAFDMAELDSEPILVYWTGTVVPDPYRFGYGMIKVFNSAYENIYNVTLPESEGPFNSGTNQTYDSYMDLHESFVTDRGSILVTASSVTHADLTSVGGPKDGWLREWLFYEIDIKTNKIFYKWNSHDHLDQIPLSATFEQLHGEGSASSSAFDYFHMNAVSLVDGNYLISSRYYCAIFLIDSKDGSVIWELQGKTGDDFKLPSDAQFCYQHDARVATMTPETIVLHMHDNANSYWDNGTTPTSGLLLSMDMTNKEVTKLARYQNPADPLYANSQGSYEPLSNGHIFMDHGYVPKMEEYDANGTCIETIQFSESGVRSTYRGFRYEWNGQPTTAPAVAACLDDCSNSIQLSVSWNGATQVQEWEVYATQNYPDGPKYLVKTVPKPGFETNITVTEFGHFSELTIQAKGFTQSTSMPVSGLESCSS